MKADEPTIVEKSIIGKYVKLLLLSHDELKQFKIKLFWSNGLSELHDIVSIEETPIILYLKIAKIDIQENIKLIGGQLIQPNGEPYFEIKQTNYTLIKGDTFHFSYNLSFN